MPKQDKSKIYTYNVKDELYSPINAITPLLKYIPNNKTIWECCDSPTEGNITKVFRDSGYNVVSTSIHKGDDFLTCKIPDGVDIICSNPPYSKKDEIIARCYAIRKPFALLLPIDSITGVERCKMYKKRPPQFIIFNRRINFINSGNNSQGGSMWLCWNLDLPNQVVFEEYEK